MWISLGHMNICSDFEYEVDNFSKTSACSCNDFELSHQSTIHGHAAAVPSNDSRTQARCIHAARHTVLRNYRPSRRYAFNFLPKLKAGGPPPPLPPPPSPSFFFLPSV